MRKLPKIISQEDFEKIFEAEKDEKKQINKPLGKILLRFITRLLNDSSMYQRGEGGNNLQQFLNEYFSIDDNAIRKAGGLSFAGFTDVKINDDNAGKIKKTKPCGFFESNKIADMRGTLKEYLKETTEEGILLKMKIEGDDKSKYFYLLKNDERNMKIWFLVFDEYGFSTTNVPSSTRYTNPTLVQLIEFNYRINDNKLEKGKQFKSKTWEVFPRKEDPIEKTFEIADVKVLLNSDDKSLNLETKLDLVKRLRGLKENVKTASNNKINL